MNEDYLWDKTGSDAEIEGLEDALSVFRYKQIDAPALPAKVLPFKKKETTRSFYKFAYAAAACIAFIAVSLGIMYKFAGDKPQETAQVIPAAQIEPKIETVVTNDDAQAGEKTFTTTPIVSRKAVKAKKYIAAPVLQTKFIASKSKILPAGTLTKEERYAYSQLMLALSITGEKLKLVSDKIEGNQQQNSHESDGR
jgi:hypothetical protein